MGPTIAATILAVAKWPWLFLVNVPFGLAVPLFIAAAPSDVRVTLPLDLIGTALNALAFGLFVVGVGTLGIGDGCIAMGEIVAGLFCFGLFVRQQLRHPRPMLPFDLLRIPLFSLSVWTSVCSYAAQILAYVSLPFLFEAGMHLSAVETGVLLTPWPFMTAITAPIAGRLTMRYPASVICSIGLALLAGGLLLMVFLPATPAKWDVEWRLALCGIGFGLFQTPNNTAMMTAGPIGRSGAASGMNAAARYVGWSLGSALVSLMFGLGGDHGVVFCLVAGMAFALIGAATSSARRFRWS
ncbi:MFS transporter [Bradyrhizobium ivorense]|uniref:MFS transporter n=1 Tax=Bradyrhizobium ivorense TaxID=2511166 RepID=UPI001AEF256B|nr:MFS transporter [Bradyrhizobium ivorense]